MQEAYCRRERARKVARVRVAAIRAATNLVTAGNHVWGQPNAWCPRHIADKILVLLIVWCLCQRNRSREEIAFSHVTVIGDAVDVPYFDLLVHATGHQPELRLVRSLWQTTHATRLVGKQVPTGN